MFTRGKHMYTEIIISNLASHVEMFEYILYFIY